MRCGRGDNVVAEMMQGEFWIIDSREKLSGFMHDLQKEFALCPHLTIKVSTAQRRSRSQEALWAIWCREQIAPFMSWTEEQARLAMYHMFRGYEDTKVSDKLTIKGQIKRFPKDHGEAYEFMNKVQEFWLTRGLLLESSGEYLENQRKEVA